MLKRPAAGRFWRAALFLSV